MWLLDQWAEKHIAEAQRSGELDNLKGSGEPLILDDDSQVPAELRVSYRLLKNSGYLPPELQLRKDALALNDLLCTLKDESPQATELRKQLALLEIRLQQRGVNTDFLHHSAYSDKVLQKLEKDK